MPSMYGIFTYMLFSFMVNLGKYTVRPIDPSWDIAPTNELKNHGNLRGPKATPPRNKAELLTIGFP